MSAAVQEYWEDGSLPRDSLSRAGERLRSRGSLYLGGGVGVELKKDGRYSVIGGGVHDGPLSAVTQALTLAGGKAATGTPGGTTRIADPAIAARIFELDTEKAEQEGTIQRMQRTLARNARANQDSLTRPTYGMGVTPMEEDRWEQRRIREAQERLKQIAQERKKLLKAGTEAKMQEAAEVGKPGTNWKQVTPENRKRVNPLVRHYMKQAHPFGACVRDNTKRFGADRAKRICAVVKDMGSGTTKWRKGRAKEAEVTAVTARLLEAAEGDVEAVETFMLAFIAERETPPADPTVDPQTGRKRRRRRTGSKREAVMGRTSAGSTGDVDAGGLGVSESFVLGD